MVTHNYLALLVSDWFLIILVDSLTMMEQNCISWQLSTCLLPCNTIQDVWYYLKHRRNQMNMCVFVVVWVLFLYFCSFWGECVIVVCVLHLGRLWLAPQWSKHQSEFKVALMPPESLWISTFIGLQGAPAHVIQVMPVRRGCVECVRMPHCVCIPVFVTAGRVRERSKWFLVRWRQIHQLM